MLWHLMSLFTFLYGKSDFNSALINLCITDFWSLAELTYNSINSPIDYSTSVLTTDVTFTQAVNGQRTVTTITLRGTKMAGPGGTQLLVLAEQPHILCPVTVRAIKPG
jgi:hypothetical protein